MYYEKERLINMQAVINASGEGTRLRPLTCGRPQALLPLCGKTIIERLIEKLRSSGADDIVVISLYMAEPLKELLKNEAGVRVIEASGGESAALKSCAGILENEFLYFSSVCYSECEFSEMIDFHHEREACATILMQRGESMTRITADRSGRVSRIEEKRLWSPSSPAGTGVYVLNKEVISFIPDETGVDIARTLMPSLVRAKMNVYAYLSSEKTEPICDLPSYMRAVFAVLDKEFAGAAWAEEGANIEKGAVLEAPCYVAGGAHIKKGAKIGAYSVIEKGSVISGDASVKRSVVMESGRAARGAALRGCVTDKGVSIGKNSAVYEQAVIGFDSTVGDNSTVRSFVRIWPEKSIGDGQTVSENIMWGKRRREKLFENDEVEGLINIDITPEVCLRIGECLGTVTAGGEIGVSGDGSAASDMLRDALIAGALSTGAAVRDFGEQPLPITRRGTAFYFLQGGAAINTFTRDGEEYASVTLIDKGGVDQSEEMRERMAELYEGGDFLRAEPGAVCEREYFFEYKLFYLKNLINSTKRKSAGLKILLSCQAKWGRRLLSSAASDFDSSVKIYASDISDAEGERGFAEAVTAGGFDMGFIIDKRCEKLAIALPGGRIVKDDEYEALTALIVMKKYKNAKIILPVTSSTAAEHMAKKYKAEVCRTKSAPVSIMKALTEGGEELSEQFIFRFDAVGAVIKLIDYISSEETGIEELLKEIPSVSMVKTEVEISRGDMTHALERVRRLRGEEEPSPEGVKITFDKGWVVVIPDSYKNVCRVVSEGTSAETASELCDICIDELLK